MSAKSSISVVERRRTQLSSSSVYIRVFPYYAVALPVTVRTALPSRRATAILAEAPDLSQTTSPILPKSRRQAFLDPCHLVQTSTEPSPGNTAQNIREGNVFRGRVHAQHITYQTWPFRCCSTVVQLSLATGLVMVSLPRGDADYIGGRVNQRCDLSNTTFSHNVNLPDVVNCRFSHAALRAAPTSYRYPGF
jgi:hypothetical protein